MELVRVLVTTSDPVTGAGLASYLEDHPSTTLLPKDKSAEADVCLVVDDHVRPATLARMENLARTSTTAGMRMVLITDLIQEQQFLRAVHLGLSSVLLRKEAVRERVVKAVIGAHAGRAEMTPVMIAWLAEHLRSIQRDILAPRALTSSGLLSREIDVLRLLADGLDTSEIALELNFSERTIKNVIHAMLTRLQLRNRTHAVAHALRQGVL
ncbi:response regulator transcription factor [Streptomyces cellostaticus]|uniref:response regulator transcription factor n=1 Tax=Streptomyces cellostaticus TaxID=67285 RepID=UPI00082BE4FE|nr:response regulator transcription factor [Streptomyces cellostaticus]